MLTTEQEIKEKEWLLEVIRIANEKNRLIEGAHTINLESSFEASIKKLKKDLYHGTSPSGAKGIKEGGFSDIKIGTASGNKGIFGFLIFGTLKEFRRN